MVIQNLDTIFLPVSPNDSYIFLPKDRFVFEKEISYIIPIKGIYNNTDLAEDFDNYYIDIFNDKKQICNKLSLTNLLQYNLYKVNSVIDFDLTKIELKIREQENKYIALSVVYCTDIEQPKLLPTNSISLKKVNNNYTTLTQIGGYQIKGKKIKKIEVIGNLIGDEYITIRTEDNQNNIYNLPLSLLMYNNQIADLEILFDNILIDPDNSHIIGGQNFNLIFKY